MGLADHGAFPVPAGARGPSPRPACQPRPACAPPPARPARSKPGARSPGRTEGRALVRGARLAPPHPAPHLRPPPARRLPYSTCLRSPALQLLSFPPLRPAPSRPGCPAPAGPPAARVPMDRRTDTCRWVRARARGGDKRRRCDPGQGVPLCRGLPRCGLLCLPLGGRAVTRLNPPFVSSGQGGGWKGRESEQGAGRLDVAGDGLGGVRGGDPRRPRELRERAPAAATLVRLPGAGPLPSICRRGGSGRAAWV